ncbi:MAG: flagellar basal body-associated FliL family protein [Phycisphaerales bacterium]|jgi:flagellar basal body-associated protein FliL
MADTDEKEKQEAEGKKDEKKKDKQEDKKSETGDKKSLISRLLPGLIIAVVMVVFAGAGFTLSRLFAGSDMPESPEQDQLTQQAEDAEVAADGSQKGWYYNLEPVVANLDVPEVTRYVRATLILEMSPDMDEEEGTAFLDEKKPILTNWLTVYLASLSINDIRGESSLKSIQSQILDSFNEKLFSDSKPKIKHILFKEFAVQ